MKNSVKQTLLWHVVLAIVSAMPLFAQATSYDFTDNGLYYKITGSNTVMTVQDESYKSLSGNVTIPETVIYQNKQYYVTAIDEYCFKACARITNIILPETMQELGKYAFSDCYFRTIELPESLTEIGDGAFTRCIRLESITIPHKVTRLQPYVFQSCSTLYTINLPNSLKSIGYTAFWNCKKLASIAIPDSVTGMGYMVFSGCSELTSVKLPEQLKEIPQSAFFGCSKLESIDLPDAVKSIGYEAFTLCSSLSSILFSRSLKTISERAFYGCSSLASVTLRDSVVSIGKYAFYDCTALNSVELSPCTETIANYAFQGCTSLSAIDFPNSIFTIGEGAFDGTAWLDNQPDGLIYVGPMAYKFKGAGEQGSHFTFRDGTVYICGGCFEDCTWLGSIDIPLRVTTINPNTFNGCTALNSVTLPGTVTHIGNYAFNNCSSLTSIMLPASLTEIGEGAFGHCTGLTAVTLPKSLTRLNGFQHCSNLTTVKFLGPVKEIYGFEGCSRLTSINLPASVTHVNDKAFYGCSALNEITCAATNPPLAYECVSSMGGFAFGSFEGVNKSTCVLHVPQSSISYYHTAQGWREFSHMQALKDNNIPGDTNGDGVVDIADVNGIINDMLDKADIVVEVNDVKFGLVKVEGGTFQMGLDYDENIQYNFTTDPSPKHTVTLHDYFIANTEVTQELYHAVMGGTPNTYEETIPVTGVSWAGCQNFINKLNETTGLSFRLPTEAEWEYAARGGKYSHGYFFSGSDNCGEIGFCAGDHTLDTPLGPWPVASLKPNELGIYDMSGNVWEWCQDWFGPYTDEALTNPQGPATGTLRVIRGGSCYSPVHFYCNVYNRASCSPTESTISGELEPIGIRLALDNPQHIVNNACDVTGDGIVDIADANAVINIMLGKGYDVPTGNQGHDTAPGKEE